MSPVARFALFPVLLSLGLGCGHPSPPSAASPASLTPATEPALLGRSLAFVRGVHAAPDLAPGQLESAFGLGGVDPGAPARYAATQALTPGWTFHVELLDATRVLIALQDQPSAAADMAAVCSPDVAAYRAALAADGFAAEEWFGEHGRHLGWHFTRGATTVTLSARGESAARLDHACVAAIEVTVADGR